MVGLHPQPVPFQSELELPSDTRCERFDQVVVLIRRHDIEVVHHVFWLDPQFLSIPKPLKNRSTFPVVRLQPFGWVFEYREDDFIVQLRICEAEPGQPATSIRAREHYGSLGWRHSRPVVERRARDCLRTGPQIVVRDSRRRVFKDDFRVVDDGGGNLRPSHSGETMLDGRGRAGFDALVNLGLGQARRQMSERHCRFILNHAAGLCRH